MLQLPPVKIEWEGRQHTLVLPCPAIDLDLAASCRASHAGEQQMQTLLRENPSLLIYASIRFEQASGAATDSLEELSAWLISNPSHLQSQERSEATSNSFHLPKLKKLVCKFNQVAKPKKIEKILGRFLKAACSLDRSIAKPVMKLLISPLLVEWMTTGNKIVDTKSLCALIDRKWGQLAEIAADDETNRSLESTMGVELNGAPKSPPVSLIEPSSNGGIRHEKKNRWSSIRKRSRTCQLNGAENPKVIKARRFQKRLLEEKLASLQQLAYGASHEINNPLANIATRAQSLIAGEKDPERLHKLGVIYEQAMRAHEMISDLMLFANPPALKYETIPLREFLWNLNHQVTRSLYQYTPGACQGCGEIKSKTKVRFAVRIAPSVTAIEADATQLKVALLALIRNSMEACRTGHEFIELRVWATEDEYYFSVSDDGIGVAPEIRRHMFDPFYSGREAGRGLGFGLSKAWRIAMLHSGDLIFVEEHSPGARFDLIIPIRRSQ